jgi:hypothetical protein
MPTKSTAIHFKELYNQFRAVHKAIRSVNPVVKDPVPEIIAKLDKYEPEAQIIIVTHLVFIYSQWIPRPPRRHTMGTAA